MWNKISLKTLNKQLFGKKSKYLERLKAIYTLFQTLPWKKSLFMFERLKLFCALISFLRSMHERSTKLFNFHQVNFRNNTSSTSIYIPPFFFYSTFRKNIALFYQTWIPNFFQTRMQLGWRQFLSTKSTWIIFRQNIQFYFMSLSHNGICRLENHRIHSIILFISLSMY